MPLPWGCCRLCLFPEQNATSCPKRGRSPAQSARPPVHPVLTLYWSVGLSLFQGSGLFFRSQLQGVMGPSAPVRRVRETVPPPPPYPTSAPSAASPQKPSDPRHSRNPRLCWGWQAGGLSKPPGMRSWGGARQAPCAAAPGASLPWLCHGGRLSQPNRSLAAAPAQGWPASGTCRGARPPAPPRPASASAALPCCAPTCGGCPTGLSCSAPLLFPQSPLPEPPAFTPSSLGGGG